MVQAKQQLHSFSLVCVVYLFSLAVLALSFDWFVGMLEPTSGCVVVEGFDYRTHSQDIRKLIGFCPQYGKQIDRSYNDKLHRFYL